MLVAVVGVGIWMRLWVGLGLGVGVFPALSLVGRISSLWSFRSRFWVGRDPLGEYGGESLSCARPLGRQPGLEPARGERFGAGVQFAHGLAAERPTCDRDECFRRGLEQAFGQLRGPELQLQSFLHLAAVWRL